MKNESIQDLHSAGHLHIFINMYYAFPTTSLNPSP